MTDEEKKLRAQIQQRKEKARQQAIEKGRKIEEISADMYFVNQDMKHLQGEILKSIQHFQQVKGKYANHKQVSMKLEFLSRALSGTLRYLQQGKIHGSMINIDDVQ